MLLVVIHGSVVETFGPDEDKELAKLLTGYQDMVGLLHVHKVAHINTQVSLKIVYLELSLYVYVYIYCVFTTLRELQLFEHTSIMSCVKLLWDVTRKL